MALGKKCKSTRTSNLFLLENAYGNIFCTIRIHRRDAGEYFFCSFFFFCTPMIIRNLSTTAIGRKGRKKEEYHRTEK